MPSPLRCRALLCACLAGVASAPHAQAGLIKPGPYVLRNHPDGSAARPFYGLRLDELFDVSDDTDRFTFDFEAEGAEMRLDYDGSTLHIFGTALGGLDDDEEFDPDWTSFVEIDFTYRFVQQVPGDDDLWVVAEPFTNTGTIRWLATGETFGLWDRPNEDGFSFRLGDEDDDEGHRDFEGISGWGWLDHTAPGLRSGSDWLFTAEFIPAPPALALLGLGVLVTGRRSRHR